MSAFEGRSKEIGELSRILFCDDYAEELDPQQYQRNKAVRAILIVGEEGIGKTSLGQELLYRSGRDRPTERFVRRIFVTAYSEEWELILADMCRELEIEATNTRTMESAILASVAKGRHLIMLDQADIADRSDLSAFVTRWCESAHESLLVLLSREEIFPNGGRPPTCHLYSLLGIEEDFVVRMLIGPDVERLVSENDLQSELDRLGRNPQKLLFLRWRNLDTAERLRETISDLQEDVALETALSDCPYSLAHVRALGRVRDAEFPEALLAFLWDRLGGGSTEVYARILSWLSEKRLLVIENRDDKLTLRLSASVHMRLQKSQNPDQLPYLDYFIAEYFRNLFSDQRSQSFETKLLERYVHHAVAARSLDSVYAYMFERDTADAAHFRARSLEMTGILSLLDKEWTLLRQSPSRGPNVEEQAARIKIDLASVYNDLTRHSECIKHLREAQFIVDQLDPNLESERNRSLQRRIWHCFGISYSQTGYVDDCIEAYSSLVVDSAKAHSVSWFDVLTLGYLAYELKFKEIDQAAAVGYVAVELARAVGDDNTLLKNLCSLGQILLYAGNTEARKVIDEADRLQKALLASSREDRREIGRVLINSSALYIYDRELDEASRRLEEGLDVTTSSGDQRRAALARAYLGIVAAHKGETQKAKALLLGAIADHWDLDAIREAIYETLTFIWLENRRFDGDLSTLRLESLPEEVGQSVERLRTDQRAPVFQSYWAERYRSVMRLQ